MQTANTRANIAATVLTERKMVVVICQIRAQSRVFKKLYGCSVAEQVILIDLYNQYRNASGQLDNSEAIPAEFATSSAACLLGVLSATL